MQDFPALPQTTEGGIVNKSELIDQIAKSADLSKAAAGRALDATIAAVKTSLKKGGMVTLVGFEQLRRKTRRAYW